jgi:hypothetical protein
MNELFFENFIGMNILSFCVEFLIFLFGIGILFFHGKKDKSQQGGFSLKRDLSSVLVLLIAFVVMFFAKEHPVNKKELIIDNSYYVEVSATKTLTLFKKVKTSISESLLNKQVSEVHCDELSYNECVDKARKSIVEVGP